MAAIVVMSGCGHAAPPSDREPVVEYDCGAGPGRVKPAAIVLACGDMGAVAENLSWARWSTQSAINHGVIRYNNCAPSCAQGHFVNYPAQVDLSEPVVAAGHQYFTRVTITYDRVTPNGRRVDVFQACDDDPPAGDKNTPRCPADLQTG